MNFNQQNPQVFQCDCRLENTIPNLIAKEIELGNLTNPNPDEKLQCEEDIADLRTNMSQLVMKREMWNLKWAEASWRHYQLGLRLGI